jgi:hypothetical protein
MCQRRVLSSGIRRRAVSLKSTDLSEERIASVPRVQEEASKQETIMSEVVSSGFFEPERGGDMFLRNDG